MIKNQIATYIEQTLNNLGIKYSNDIIVQDPRNQKDVHYCTNIAMLLTKQLKISPIDIAGKIVNDMTSDNTDFFEAISIAKPGFINFKLNASQYSKNLMTIINQGGKFGRSSVGRGKKALVEFVSANPTGPLTIGHGRGAIIGEFSSNILDWNGYQVEREYYFNNAGRQMRKLAESVYSHYAKKLNKEVAFPEDGYQGKYIIDIAQKLIDDFSDDFIDRKNLDDVKEYSEKIIFNDIQKTLKSLKIEFDNFFNETQLYENNEIYKIIDALKEKGLIYELDNATWFKATSVGREQDRVLIKSTGEPTYRLPDMAYHKNKFDRNFDLIIDVFGADHMDAYPDVLSVCENLGYDTSKVKVLVHQFVTIQENGKPIKMSTRKANFISLEDLINDVGADVVKFFFSMRGINSHLNFDLDLAKDESEQNPVFYIQYAHARAVNILYKSKDEGILKYETFNHDLLIQDEEINLIKSLIEFPELINKSMNEMEPQLISNYLMDIASKFHHYYAKHKVITDNKALSNARTVLVDSIRQILFNGLNVLGISAPDKM